ncbi:MAG TPA: hypothetical protein ENN03_05395 [bacterium]|nr:hypothetical protein [bacterium]
MKRMSPRFFMFGMLLLYAGCWNRAGAVQWLRGYEKDIAGEILTYHSPYQDQTTSLLVRSLDRSRTIEWETGAIPHDRRGDAAVFVWAFGIDVNSDAHNFRLFIDEQPVLTFRTPEDTTRPDWTVKGLHGVSLRFRSTLIDKYGDFMGYAFLEVPNTMLTPGRRLRLAVAGESAGSRTWYMTFRNGFDRDVTIDSEPAILRRGERQPLRVRILHFESSGHAEIRAGGGTVKAPLNIGYNEVQIAIPRVRQESWVPVRVRLPGSRTVHDTVRVMPVKEKTLFLLHHSHVDIGYTHIQSEVEAMQWSHLETAMGLADASRDFPAESRFKWNVEVMWAVDSYLRRADPKKRDRFIQAIRDGSIGLNALYGNLLTGLCRSEELFRQLDPAVEISRLCGVPLISAMITDIPGTSWGLVTALAQRGIRYLSIGTNTGHRIGHVLETWADRPFYWISPSGEEKILCWVAGKGYSWFHSRLGFHRIQKRLHEKAILDYLRELDAEGYPYDIGVFRYNIGSDNGPPDPMLSNQVSEWNEKFLSPRMIISTVDEAFSVFEEKYGHTLPAFRGDFTGYWEDGAASSARETAMNRQAAERLVQAEILWSLLKPSDYPRERFGRAWRQVFLYSEHTWGSWNSISEPHSPFTLQQWEIKKSFAETAREESFRLMEEAAAGSPFDGEHVWVMNTLSWPREDVVILDAGLVRIGDRVVDDEGNSVSTQRLRDGSLVFIARVPALAARLYRVRPGEQEETETSSMDFSLSAGSFSLDLDPVSGGVNKAAHRKYGTLVDEKGSGWNVYRYVKGRDPSNVRTSEPVRMRAGESGPLIRSVKMISEAPGCDSLVREIRIINGLNRVEMINTIYKKEVFDPEAVYFEFPFNLPEGEVRIDGAWSVFRPDAEQLPGSCKNYFAPQRWVDISDETRGVTWVTPDVPMVQIGRITADPVAVGWLKKTDDRKRLFAYVMNNYWETNYRAAQPGPVTVRFRLFPHGPFVLREAKKRGMESGAPLLLLFYEPDPALKGLDLPEGILITSIRPLEGKDGWQVRLFNARGDIYYGRGEGFIERAVPPFGVRLIEVIR